MSGNGGSNSVDMRLVEFRTEHHEQVRAVFDSVASATHDSAILDRISGEFPRKGEALRAATAALRDLLRIEQRPDRFRRILRVWSGKVKAAIRDGEYGTAGLWMRAVTENPVFPGEYSIHVAEAIQELSAPELLEELVIGLAKAENPQTAAPLLAAWGEPLVNYLIQGMVVDEPPVHRKHLTEYLGMAGRNDVRLLTRWLTDPRWFIVRNVATAVGKSGREAGIPALTGTMSHEDDRVRVEVIRALTALEGDDAIGMLASALRDDSQRVRNAAVSLLRSIPADEVVHAIRDYLIDGTAQLDDARRLIKIIAERKGTESMEALELLASKKIRGSSGRAIRETAGTILGGRR